MSTIFEVYGHRLNDTSEEAQRHRAAAWCPFLEARCDGGGNRYLTEIDLTQETYRALRELFTGLEHIVPGVCSLIPVRGQPPWIVCPRRLLALRRQQTYQRNIEARLLQLLKYPAGTRLGIWQEVKIKHRGVRESILKLFDYTFDYILMPIADIALTDLLPQNATRQQSGQLKRDLIKRGFQIGGAHDIVHDYPIGIPSIIEIMTSSTSGGNKRSRTQIPQRLKMQC
jgi:hypothetical protein